MIDRNEWKEEEAVYSRLLKLVKNLFEHRRMNVEVEILTVVTVKGVTCDNCYLGFINTEGLRLHSVKSF